MEKQVLSLKVGDKVTIKSKLLGKHSDYRKEVATVTNIKAEGGYGYKIEIQWPDGKISAGDEKFFNLVIGDWDI